MIQLTHVPSERAGAPSLVLIPGGPGLSSYTLRSMDELRRSFHLYYVDFPGTNGVEFDRAVDFASLSRELAGKVSALTDPVFLFGHSFGGFFAARLAIDLPEVGGLICAAVPFSAESQKTGYVNYVDAKHGALAATAEAWERMPSDSSFSAWLSEYGELYFSRENLQAGKNLMATDRCSHALFLSIRGEAKEMDSMVAELRDWGGRKLFLAGAHDGLLPNDILQRDAERMGFAFRSIAKASHFVTFDRPEEVAKNIEDYFLAQKKETL